MDGLTGAAVILNVTSGVAIAALGAASLLGGRARARGALAFGLFAISWGLQITFVNLAGRAGSAGTASLLYLLSLAFLLPLAYFLVEFVAAQVGGQGDRGLWDLLRLSTGGLAIGAASILIVSPGWLFDGVRLVDDFFVPLWGELHVPLVSLPHFAALGLALFVLGQVSQSSPTPRTASRAATLVVGLGMYLAFTAANNLVVFASRALNAPTGNDLSFTLLFAGITLLTLLLGLQATRAARSARTPPEARRERRVALALLVPLGWGLVEGGLVLGALPGLDTVGLWRLSGVAVMAFGLARWWLPELPRQAQRVAAGGVGVTGAATGGIAVYGVGSLLTAGGGVPALAAVLATGATLVPSLRLSRNLFGLPERIDPSELADERFGQQLDTYRAALEASLSRDTLEEDASFLEALQERFGISEDARRVLMYYARKSVVVTRGEDAADSYERLRLLGEGGGGRTWLARDRVRERLIVLKEPLGAARDEAIRERVLKEARLAQRVRHPNVVRIEEVILDEGRPLIVMEYVDGGSLAELLDARGSLEPGSAVEMMQHVLSGLSAVHEDGIAHRDIKPSNILLTAEGEPKLADFGIAARTEREKTRVAGDQDHAGTLTYMAPEVRAGTERGGVRQDIYACGVVLHEMLHGVAPEPGEIRASQGVPRALTELVRRALSVTPTERPSSASAFADELVRAAGSLEQNGGTKVGSQR